jgi:hypothetical protein
MKSISFAKALTVGCLMSLALPIACGDDDDDSPGPNNIGGDGNSAGEPSSNGGTGNMMTPAGGEGGTGTPALVIPGTSTTSKTLQCGGEACKSTSTLLPTLFVDPCCTEDDACGVDTEFLVILQASFPAADKCQPKNQPGEPDATCPTSAAKTLPVNGKNIPVPGFAGCCRADTGTCGVLMDDVVAMGFGKFTSPMLGCVDAAPFFPGAEPKPCGAGVGGGGGGGAGGASGGGADGGGAGGESSGGASLGGGGAGQ